MGFLDSIFKAVKKASEIVSEVEAIKERAEVKTSAPAPQTAAVNPPDYAVNVKPAKPSVKFADSFFDEDENGNSIETEFGFMISGDFIEVKSHAAEIETLFIYAPDSRPEDVSEATDKPYIFISAGDETVYQLVEEFKQKGNVDGLIKKCEGKALFKCKTDYYGSVMVFYGMDRGTIRDNSGICLVYNKNIVGTPLEAKLIAALDEAAETYTERIIGKEE